MQNNRYFTLDGRYEWDFTDNGKKVIRDENGWFAYIDFLLFEAGIIPEIPYETNPYQVE